MKNIILFFKYYLYGFLIAAVIGVLLVIYSLVFDNTYSYIDFSLYMQVNSIMAVPCGLHLWIFYLLDKPQAIKNKYHKLFFKGIASYWIGVIISFLLLCSVMLLNSIFSIDFINYITEDNLLEFTLLMAFPFGFFSKFLIINK
jgi:hypothetical protein